ncbi:hypothetical protein Hdeb2414_s0009g00323631 [Helianthus debilis subsp. tardiflorus]
MKEQRWIHEGLITKLLPNGMFLVRLDNEDEDMILGHVSGKIRRSFIRILPGDRVEIEVSRYDSTRGGIIYRLRNKDSKDQVFFNFTISFSFAGIRFKIENYNKLIFLIQN